MTKKHFIDLADTIRFQRDLFSDQAIEELARFCKSQNGQFNKERWIGYIKGECGPSGGSVKTPKVGKEDLT